MNDRSTTWETLRALHQAKLSRNSAYELFRQPRYRRIHRLYRRLVSLVAELARPEAAADFSAGADDYALRVEVETLHYRRTIHLDETEAAFFLFEMGGAAHCPSPLVGSLAAKQPAGAK